MDPWYDYLALPVAPMILLVQGAAVLFVPQRAVRWTLVGGCVVAIAAMLVYIATLPAEGEGANIGAGVMSLWLLVSVGMVVVARGRGSAGQAERFRRITTAAGEATWSKTALASLVVTLLYPPFAAVAVAAAVLAWWREPSSTTRVAATWLSGVAAAYAGVYFVVEM